MGRENIWGERERRRAPGLKPAATEPAKCIEPKTAAMIDRISANIAKHLIPSPLFLSVYIEVHPQLTPGSSS